ncbi:MAG: hypothetical protein ABF441_13700 [Lentilactobacillus hilgardii]|uniref:hypothetical protein n=1 Tax=Lentilactobacillus hilgardii TaxID=1588 RepID=UPI0039E79222
MRESVTELQEKIFIEKSNFKPIVKELTKFAKSKIANEPYYSSVVAKNVKVTDKNSANIYFGEDTKDTDDLVEILNHMLFEPKLNDNGDLVAMNYVGSDKYMYHGIWNHSTALEEFFDVVVPFVKEGSVISFEKKIQEFVQYSFNGKTMSKKIGEIVWKD